MSFSSNGGFSEILPKFKNGSFSKKNNSFLNLKIEEISSRTEFESDLTVWK